MGKNQDPGSGINIPDPLHCYLSVDCNQDPSSDPDPLKLLKCGVGSGS